MTDRPRILVGAMSGTSADGVDVAVTRICGRGLEMSAELVHHHHVAYDATIRQAIFQIRESGHLELKGLAELGRLISLSYARGINEALEHARLHPSEVSSVAAHGQTLYHNPPDTIQWLDPALIASQTGCAVISDFRRADCAAGGQGAPLVPFADWILFRHPTRNRVLLNIGGIANITYLKAGRTLDDVIAFDTGPGNCISDWICRTRGPFNLSWDAEGERARKGSVQAALVDRFLSAPCFHSSFPESTDVPAMVTLFEAALAEAQMSIELNDLLATAAQITARMIHHGIAALQNEDIEVIASGGGTHNKAILQALGAMRSPRLQLVLLDDLGWKSQAKEAIAFAILGAATLDGVPSNVPSATGANRAVVLGSITPKPA